MKKLAALLSIIVPIAFAAAQAVASSPPSTSVSTQKPAEPPAQTKLFKTTPAAAPTSSPNADHTFPVNDVKGLLLTCIAPQIDTNPDTDIFKNCTLAPGRTLDDVMHTFVQAIHFIQNEQAKEREEWYGDHKEELVQKHAQK
jgi:hypothetical protein